MTILSRIVLLLSIMVSMTALAAPVNYLSPADINALATTAPDKKIPYGADPLQYGNLRLPQGTGPFPVIVILHGGCWLASLATVQNTESLAEALRGEGYATWNVEYRSADNEGGGWPGTFLDVAHATDYLRALAKTYHLDLQHVTVMGHSAGGHLAFWLAARHNLSASSPLYTSHPLKLKGVVALAGIPDLSAWQEHGAQVCGSDGVSALVGGDATTQAARFADASPINLLPLHIPQILIFGADDNIVPAQYAEAYVQAAKAKGDNVSVMVVPDAGHFELIAPNSVAWASIKAALQTINHSSPP
jgi:acetyl esterase/lipase